MEYGPKTREKIMNIVIILLILVFIGYLFYGNIVGALFLVPSVIPIYRQRKQKIIMKNRKEMERQLKDMLIAVSDAMNTGYSIENAIKESYRDIIGIYGYNSAIGSELRLIISRLKLNVSIEVVLQEFASRIEIEDALLFEEIFSVAKRTGGNMTEVIRNVTNNLVLKRSVQEDIDVAINEKRMEQKVMTIIPIFIIVYITIASPGFLDIMYGTWMGRIIMTVFLVAYILAYLWSQKITSIEI